MILSGPAGSLRTGSAGFMSSGSPAAGSTRTCSAAALVYRVTLPGDSSPARVVTVQYDPTLPFEECLAIAREVKEYENAYLTQQIAFLETIHEYFTVNGLRHDPKVHKQCLQQIRKGIPGTIKVFHAGELEEYRIPKPGI